MLGWILAGLASATAYNVINKSENSGNKGNQNKPQYANCPHCKTQMMVSTSKHKEITCPGCRKTIVSDKGVLYSLKYWTKLEKEQNTSDDTPKNHVVNGNRDKPCSQQDNNIRKDSIHNDTHPMRESKTNNISWIVKTISMSENPPSLDVKPYLTNNFYISSYLCPNCGRNLYKTVFRVGGEECISVSGNKHIMKRLFTCLPCLSFYAPIEGHRLSDGSVYYLKCEYSDDYLPFLTHYDSIGTTQGRPDA